MLVKIFLLFAVALIAQSNAYTVRNKNGTIIASRNDHYFRHNPISSPAVNELFINGSFIDFIYMNTAIEIKATCRWYFDCNLPRIWLMTLRNVENVSSVNEIPQLFRKASNVSEWLLSYEDKDYIPAFSRRMIVKTPLFLVRDVTRPSTAFRTKDAKGVIFYTKNTNSTYEITSDSGGFFTYEEWRLEVDISYPVGVYLKEGKVGFWFTAQLASS